MKKHHFAICVLLLIGINVHLHPQIYHWENISNQIPGDSLNNLSDVFVPNRWAVYASSLSYSEIYRTDFSPIPWEVLQTPSPVIAFGMTDYENGFICGIDSSVYLTTDAGITWIYFGTLEESINDIDIGSDPFYLEGFVCGNNGVIGVIEDTGLVIIQSGLATDFIRVSAPMEDKVWLVGDSSVYLYDGITFSKQFTSNVKLNSLYFWNELYGLVVGDSGYIAKTTDGGNIWTQKQNPDPSNRNLNDIYFVSYFGFTVGDNGLILETTDAGETWLLDTGQLTTNDLQAVHIAGGGVEWGPGLVVGKNKTVLLYPIIVSVDDKAGPADNFYLYQNYPNPFNPKTNIKFQIANSGFVGLKVYDILGNEIATLLNEEIQSGTVEIEFDALGLPSGIYFYQLQAGSFIQTRKMVYLK